jgi:hypothetical protein
MTDDTTSADGSSPDAPGEAGLAVIPALPYYAHGSGWPAARALAVIGCRLVALFVLYQGTVWLGYLVPALLNAARVGFSGSSAGLETLPMVAGPFAATCAVAAFLWWKAGWLADRMVGAALDPAPPDDREELPPGTPPASAAPAVPSPTSPSAGGGEGSHSLTLSIALAAVGALVVAGGVPELFRSLFVAIFDRENDFSAWWQSIEWHGQLWAGVLKCALGFWLLLGSRGVAHFVRNLRHSSTTARDENGSDRADPADSGDDHSRR